MNLCFKDAELAAQSGKVERLNAALAETKTSTEPTKETIKK